MTEAALVDHLPDHVPAAEGEAAFNLLLVELLRVFKVLAKQNWLGAHKQPLSLAHL